MKVKNILFYIPNLTQENGGIRQYASGLLNLISTFPENYKFYVLHDNNDQVIIDIIKSNSNLTLVLTASYKASFTKKVLIKLFNIAALTLNELFRQKIPKRFFEPLNEIISHLNIDIIHCPYQFIPTIKNVKLICTMHDVQELHFPEFFIPEERAYRAMNYNRFIKESDVVVVSYEHIRKDIIKYFQKEKNNVHVLLLKMNNLWFNNYKFNGETSCFQMPFEKYLFYPANMWLHKNHINILKALKLLKEKGVIINMIFSGDNNSKNGHYIKKVIQEYNLYNQIKLVGIVNETELFNLYNHAQGVVIPTLYEAGSFPLMECILMEIPVICSNVTSLPETIGNKMFIFDPKDVESIALKMEELWTDKIFSELSISNSKVQRHRLIETNAENILMSIYDGIEIKEF